VVSFTFCQPYAWEACRLLFSLTALFGAGARPARRRRWLFLGGGLVLVLSLLFSDPHHHPRPRRTQPRGPVAGPAYPRGDPHDAGHGRRVHARLLIGVTPLAYALGRLRFPGRELLLSLIDLPIVIPQSAAGIALLCLLGRRQFLAACWQTRSACTSTARSLHLPGADVCSHALLRQECIGGLPGRR